MRLRGVAWKRKQRGTLWTCPSGVFRRQVTQQLGPSRNIEILILREAQEVPLGMKATASTANLLQ